MSMRILSGILLTLFLLGSSHSLVRIAPSTSKHVLSSNSHSLFSFIHNSKLKSRVSDLNLRIAGGSDEEKSEDNAADSNLPQANDTPTNETATANATAVEKPPPSPEVVQSMNFRLWEAARDGNEPLVDKALKAGANINAFCRGPDKWMNISVGEIAGADEYTTGLNVHWMELNNYTALHLAAASGNAAVIDKACKYCSKAYLFSIDRRLTERNSKPVIYKCTPLRLARAANCGRCFFTSYQKSVDKLIAYGAEDRDFRFPLNTVIWAMAFGLAWAGLKGWPWNWFSEWPFDWYQYPDLAAYLPGGANN